MLLQNVSLHDQIGHLYVVDIEFDHIKATEKQIVYNEIYPSIIEKQKVIDPCERSVYQLLEQFSEQQLKELMQRYSKKIQPLYLEQLCFAINRAGWSVTKIYSHYTFEQEFFKKKFHINEAML